MARKRTPRRTPRRKQTPRRTSRRKQTLTRKQTPRRRRSTNNGNEKGLKAGLTKKSAVLGVAGIVGLGTASLVGLGAYTTKKASEKRIIKNLKVYPEKMQLLNTFFEHLNQTTGDSVVNSHARVILVIGTGGTGKSAIINGLTGKTTCNAHADIHVDIQFCSETDNDNNLYIETIGLGTDNDNLAEDSLRNMAKVVIENGGINLIMFVMYRRITMQEELNAKLIKYLFPNVPILVVSTGLDGTQRDTPEVNEINKKKYKTMVGTNMCNYLFGTFRTTVVKGMEDERTESFNLLRPLITECASTKRITLTFGDKIKNVFSNVYQLGLVGLITLVTKNKDPFQKQEISSNI